MAISTVAIGLQQYIIISILNVCLILPNRPDAGIWVGRRPTAHLQKGRVRTDRPTNRLKSPLPGSRLEKLALKMSAVASC
ncbi:MAG: hypothetical protein SWY16_03485 [Cyanobacteriota bacterium]|nr:hypothetical protein [Cyanobacteriota bacterium]